MSRKETILQRVRSAIADEKLKPQTMPPIPEVWDSEGLSQDEMSQRFGGALEAVKGEFVSCGSLSEAVARISELLKEIGAENVAVLDRPLSRGVAKRIDGVTWHFAPDEPENASAASMSAWDAGLASPEYLLADSGSCLFTAPVAFDRLTTYLMPVAIVVADKSMLRENLPSVFGEMKPRLESTRSGEFVVVTGPSRTADIEKILILGVHGPKRLVVFLIDA